MSYIALWKPNKGGATVPDTHRIRDRDGDLYDETPDTAPACICDGSGFAGIILITGPNGRPKEIMRVCRACRPDTARRLPTIAQRATHGLRPHLHAVG